MPALRNRVIYVTSAMLALGNRVIYVTSAMPALGNRVIYVTSALLALGNRVICVTYGETPVHSRESSPSGPGFPRAQVQCLVNMTSKTPREMTLLYFKTSKTCLK